MLDEKLLLRLLRERGIDNVGIVYYKKTDSTNERARQYARENCGEEKIMLFVADEQTKGRGRRGRSFVSRRGAGIYMTMLLYPSERGREATHITAESAVKLRRAILRLAGMDVKIKWINDLYARTESTQKYKKLSGILTETEMDSNGRISALYLGMGINVYKNAISDEIKDIATSIEDVTGDRISREKLICEIVCETLLSDDSDTLLGEYRDCCLYLGEEITVRPILSKEYSARAIEILPDYSMLVERESGEREQIFSAEVSTKL